MNDAERDQAELVRENEALRRLVATLAGEAQRFKTTLHSIGDAVISADAYGNVLEMNPVAEALTGWSEIEAQGRPVGEVFKIVDEAARSEAESPVARVLREGAVVGLANHTLLVGRDGTERPIADSGAPIYDEQGTLTGVVLVFRDRTEERAAERALSTALARQEALLASVPDIIMEVDANRVYTWANQPGREFFGGDVLGREAAFYFEGEQDTYDRVRPLFEGDELTFYVESWQRRRDGEKRLLAWWCRPVKDEAGRVTGALSTARDVTEERRAAAEIHQAEERFRTFFDDAPIGKSMTSPDGKLLRVNRALCSMLGYSAEELQSKTFVSITHPDDLADTWESVRAFVAGERDTWTTQKRYIAKDGRLVWAHVTTSLQRDSDGKPLHFLTHILDIGERKRAEGALRQSEARLRAILDATPFPVALVDVEDNDIEFWSQSALTLFGHTAPTASEWYRIAYPDPDYRREVIERWKPALEAARLSARAVNTGEYRVTCRDGSVRVCELYAAFMTDGLVVTFNDITERQRAEEALRESEERYRSLVEQANEAICVAQDGRIVFTNRVGAELVGYSHQEFVSRPLVEFIHPDDRAMVAERHLRRLKGEQLEPRYSFRLITKQNDVKWVELGAALITYNGRPATVNLMADITERKRAQEALEESQLFNESLLRTIPFPMDVVDQEGRVLFMNERLQGLVGEQSSGVHCWTCYRDDRQQCEHCPLKREITIGQTRVLETSGVFGGRAVEVFHTGMVFQGKPALLEIFNDVTERKQFQAQLAQSDRLTTMGALAAGVAHEINNPLSFVLYNMESLRDDMPKLTDAMRRCHALLSSRVGVEGVIELLGGDVDLFNPATFDDVAARFRDAVTGILRIRDVARGLGTFSRVERTEVGPVDVHRAAEHAINMAYNEIKYRARLVKDFGKVPMVLGSDGKLAQVFLNLLINAAQAIGEGGAEHNEIRVRTWAEGDHVFAEVSDTGKGIAPEHQGKMFEPFFTTKRPGVGTGLGLSISKSIITEFGGEIGFTSEAGKGTRFLIRLPRVANDWEAGQKVAQAPASARPKLRGRILVVDDEAGIRAAIARMLGREHEVVTASSGKEARALLESDRRFDLLFCDLMMPELSGMQLHAWLSEEDATLAEQIVFITGGAFTPGAAEYLSKVGNLRVEKPFDSGGFKKLADELILAARAKQKA